MIWRLAEHFMSVYLISISQPWGNNANSTSKSFIVYFHIKFLLILDYSHDIVIQAAKLLICLSLFLSCLQGRSQVSCLAILFICLFFEHRLSLNPLCVRGWLWTNPCSYLLSAVFPLQSLCSEQKTVFLLSITSFWIILFSHHSYFSSTPSFYIYLYLPSL